MSITLKKEGRHFPSFLYEMEETMGNIEINGNMILMRYENVTLTPDKKKGTRRVFNEIDIPHVECILQLDSRGDGTYVYNKPTTKFYYYDKKKIVYFPVDYKFHPHVSGGGLCIFSESTGPIQEFCNKPTEDNFMLAYVGMRSWYQQCSTSSSVHYDPKVCVDDAYRRLSREITDQYGIADINNDVMKYKQYVGNKVIPNISRYINDRELAQAAHRGSRGDYNNFIRLSLPNNYQDNLMDTLSSGWTGNMIYFGIKIEEFNLDPVPFGSENPNSVKLDGLHGGVLEMIISGLAEDLHKHNPNIIKDIFLNTTEDPNDNNPFCSDIASGFSYTIKKSNTETNNIYSKVGIMFHRGQVLSNYLRERLRPGDIRNGEPVSSHAENWSDRIINIIKKYNAMSILDMYLDIDVVRDLISEVPEGVKTLTSERDVIKKYLKPSTLGSLYLALYPKQEAYIRGTRVLKIEDKIVKKIEEELKIVRKGNKTKRDKSVKTILKPIVPIYIINAYLQKLILERSKQLKNEMYFSTE